jgi:hypothetical protein
MCELNSDIGIGNKEQTSMETEHTPGPWTAAWNDDRKWCGVDCGDKGDPHRAEVCSVCLENLEIDDDARAWERAKADARLIAAAPDLLVVLQEMLDYARNTRAAIPEHVLAQARAVLSRVKREDSILT